MLNHSRDMSFNRGFLKEDALQSMRDELAHRDGGYQKPPKTIHEHRMVGEAPRDFSKQEILDGLIATASNSMLPIAYCNLGRYYWQEFHDAVNALWWLRKAADSNFPDAIELIGEIQNAERNAAISRSASPGASTTTHEAETRNRHEAIEFKVLELALTSNRSCYLLLVREVGESEWMHSGLYCRMKGKDFRCSYPDIETANEAGKRLCAEF